MRPNVPRPTNIVTCFSKDADECVAVHAVIKKNEKSLDELKKKMRDLAREERKKNATADGVEIIGTSPHVKVLVSFVRPRVSFNEGTSLVDMRRAQVLLGNEVVKVSERIAPRKNMSVAAVREAIGAELFNRLFDVENVADFDGAAFEKWVQQNEDEENRKRCAGETSPTVSQALSFVRSVTTTKEETPRVSI